MVPAHDRDPTSTGDDLAGDATWRVNAAIQTHREEAVGEIVEAYEEERAAAG
jgi:hypothetical protein